MDIEQAEMVAQALGGSAWNSGGGIYLVRIERGDGHLIVISDEVICEYEDERAFDDNRLANSITFHQNL